MLNLDLFQALLQDGRLDLGEELANVLEAEDLVLLKQPSCVRLRLLLDKVSEMARLGVKDFPFGFDLANCVEGVKGANHHLARLIHITAAASVVFVSTLEDTAEEVITRRRHPVVEDGCIVEIVLQEGDSIELLLVDLPEHVKSVKSGLLD